ncbi:MAG TPA: DUF2059 domain-containing protein [Pseudomonadales bacterium]|nr:DUF2059 domain-containing protein [Pseudomonadales bacterium]
MKRTRIPGLALALLFGGLALPALADRYEDLLDLSGYTTQLDLLPEQFTQGMRMGFPAAGSGEPELLVPLLAAVDDAYDPRRARAQAATALRAALAPEEVAGQLDWYRSDFGSRIAAAEVAASAPEANAEMMSVAARLMGDAERVARATRMIELAGVTDYLVATQMRVSGAVFLLVTSQMPAGAAPELADFQAQLEASEPAMRFQMNQVMLASYLYTYRDLSIDELDRYLAFLETPVTRRSTGALVKVMQDVNDGLIAGVLAELGIQAQGLFERARSSPA